MFAKLRIPSLRASASDRKSTRLNSSHGSISYAVFCLKKKTRTAGFRGTEQRVRRGAADARGQRACTLPQESHDERRRAIRLPRVSRDGQRTERIRGDRPLV